MRTPAVHLQRLLQGWNRFWFAPQDLFALSLMRIQLAGVMLYLYLFRHFNNLPDFTDESLVPRAKAYGVIPEYYRPPFAFYELWPDSAVAWVHGLFLALLFLILIGAWSRWFAWIAWVLALGFVQRNYSILFGADVISTIFLGYLALTRHDEHLSLRSWFESRRGRAAPLSVSRSVSRTTPSLLSSVGFRLLQIHLSVIYAYTGLEKLKGVTWWDGTALWNVLGNPQMVVFDMSFMRYVPLVVAGLTYATVVFEIYWPFAMLVPWARRVWLVLGLAFHLGIGVIMGLTTFSLTMTSIYYLFIPPETLRRWVGRLSRG